MTIFRFYKEIFIKSSNWNIAVFQFCTPIQQRASIIHISQFSSESAIHGLQQARLPCPSLTPRAFSNSCPSSQWCDATISPSVVHFSSCLQAFPASGSFLVSQFFASSGQSIGVSASASVLPVPIQDWFPLGMDWLDLLAVQRTLKNLLQHHSSKASILRCSSGEEHACQCRRHKRNGFSSQVGKIPWRRAQQPTSVFLPG